MSKNILIVYFSGTGGVKRVAEAFENSFIKNNFTVTTLSLHIQEYNRFKETHDFKKKHFDIMLVLYAVHAMDAPEPIYNWINDLPINTNTKTAVISVSGGGDVWPNTSCRVYCIKALEKKGYKVFYENMLVMPSNWIVSSGDHVVMWLLKVLPQKVEKITKLIVLEKEHRTGFKLSTRLLFFVPKYEKKSAKIFGKSLKISNNCTGCGWCNRNCPVGNIKMNNNKPEFQDKCIICLNCVYGCPNKSIVNTKYSYITIKEGFNISEIEKRMEGIELEPVEKCCKGIFWGGVKKYLLDKDDE